MLTSINILFKSPLASVVRKVRNMASSLATQYTDMCIPSSEECQQPVNLPPHMFNFVFCDLRALSSSSSHGTRGPAMVAMDLVGACLSSNCVNSEF